MANESEQSADAVREVHEWMRSCSEDEQRVMRVFPPCCHVQSAPGHSHYVPGDGDVAMVIGYAVRPQDNAVQSIIVIGTAKACGDLVKVRTYVNESAVEVEAYGHDLLDREITPAYVDAVLSAADLDAAENAVQALQVQT